MLQRTRCSQGILALVIPFFLTSPVAAGEGDMDLRLGDDVVPVFQAVHLVVDADQTSYSGSVAVDLRVERSTPTVLFHSLGPELQNLRLVHVDERGEHEVAVRREAAAHDVVSLTAEEPLVEKGSYRLEIDFTNEFDVRATSLYRAEAGGHAYTFTQFEAVEAREAFPCWDEPSFKIPYQVTLTTPEAHLAITNMPVEKETVEDGLRTTVFKRSPPMPSYLLALATGPFDTVDMPGLGVPARIVTIKGQAELTTLAREVTPPILKALEAYFDSPYPYRKLDFIAVPEFWPGAMENPGAVTYADRLLVMDSKTATVGQRRAQVRVIAHELAHQWFGNLVTMEWWDDLWLNESFADWMADKIAHQLYPELDFDVSGVRSGQRIMIQDSAETSVAVRKPITDTETLLQDVGLAYAKGKTVLAMFESWLGEEAFRRGVLRYIKSREWKNAAADDLWKALDEASGKSLGASMAGFIDQPGVPRVAVEWLGDGKVRLSQERFRNYGAESEDLQWRIPVTLRYGSGGSSASKTASKTLLLTEKTQVVDLGLEGDPSWLHPNADARGYYQWSLSADALQALADHAQELSEVERINLVTNASALLRAGEVDGAGFLAVLTRAAEDPEPTVVVAAMGELGLVETALVPDSLDEEYGVWVRAAFGPAVERFGKEKKPGEPESVAMMRPGLLRLMAEDGEDEAVTAYFRELGQRFLKDPASVDPSLSGLALRSLAENGDAELFDTFQARAEGAEMPRLRSLYLGSLGAFEDEALQRRAMTYAVEGPVRPNEIFNVVGAMGGTEEGRDKLFQFLMDNWDALNAKMPPEFRAFMPRLAGGCSEERMQRAVTFFTEPDHQGPGVDRALAQLREGVRDCVALRARESASVKRFLTSFEG